MSWNWLRRASRQHRAPALRSRAVGHDRRAAHRRPLSVRRARRALELEVHLADPDRRGSYSASAFAKKSRGFSTTTLGEPYEVSTQRGQGQTASTQNLNDTLTEQLDRVTAQRRPPQADLQQVMDLQAEAADIIKFAGA